MASCWLSLAACGVGRSQIGSVSGALGGGTLPTAHSPEHSRGVHHQMALNVSKRASTVQWKRRSGSIPGMSHEILSSLSSWPLAGLSGTSYWR